MSKWCKIEANFDYQDDLNRNKPNRFSRYGKQTVVGKKSSIRRNLFPDGCPSFYFKAKSVLSSSVTRVNKALVTLKTKISAAAQNLQFNSYQRHTVEDLEHMASDFQTPSRKTRIILGRTPIKLYSPFGIETPIMHQ